MAISPRPPVLGPINNTNYRHGDDYVPPAHMIKREQPIEIKKPDPDNNIPNMLPGDPIETTYDRDKIIASQPVPKVRPVLLGLRKAITARRLERANAKIEELAHRQLVLRHVGRSTLTGNTHSDKKIAGQPNIYRPSLPVELRAARKLNKITGKKRWYEGISHGASHNIVPPVPASRNESKHAEKSSELYAKTRNKIDKLDARFGKVIAQPSKKAAEVAARRNRLIIKQEAIDRAIQQRN